MDRPPSDNSANRSRVTRATALDLLPHKNCSQAAPRLAGAASSNSLTCNGGIHLIRRRSVVLGWVAARSWLALLSWRSQMVSKGRHAVEARSSPPAGWVVVGVLVVIGRVTYDDMRKITVPCAGALDLSETQVAGR